MGVMSTDRRRFLALVAAAGATGLARVAGAAQAKRKAAPRPAQLPPATLTGPNAAEAIRGMRPGQYLWAPNISPAGPVLAIVSLPVQRCYVYRNGVLIAVSTVSSGKKGHATPTGIFTVLQKHVDHKSNLYNAAPMPFMQRLTWDGIALHAGHLPGYPASHGCVRMPMEFARKLYGETKLGMTVVVTDREAVPRVAPTPNLLQAARGLEPQLAGDASWNPEASPSGPVSLVLSGTDRRLLVLRNGVLIGSAPVQIDGPIVATTAFTLTSVEGGTFRWLQLPLPGQSLAGDHEMTAAERGRVQLPGAFRAALDKELQPGTTLVVTNDSMSASGEGEALTVIDATR